MFPKLRVWLLVSTGLVPGLFAQTASNNPQKSVPPTGIVIPETERAELAKGLEALQGHIQRLMALPAMAGSVPNVDIFYRAVHDALTYNEFFDPKQVELAKKLLQEGNTRAEALARGEVPWNTATGLVVRGYRSRIDDSVQPYGLVIPASWKPSERTPRPLYCWLHGRSETLSELAFLNDRMSKPGEFIPDGALVLHLYGRFCNANKFAGEIDLFEALADVKTHYSINPDQIAVVGFSMGGAACWHFAAHHAGLWAAASPGAGFAETAEYSKAYAPGKEPPPWWEQVLWRFYDATAYAGNLTNTSLVAYSGEIDPQKQSADIMERAMAAEGLKLERLVGPQTAHKYEPQTKKALQKRLEELVAKGRDPVPKTISFTTFTLRYNQMKWLQIDGLKKHWERAHVDASLEAAGLRIKTQNVTALSVQLPAGIDGFKPGQKPVISIDGQNLPGPVPTKGWQVRLALTDGKWAFAPAQESTPLAKRHGLTGPIDDAFMDRFIFVRPTGTSQHPKVAAWVEAEMRYAIAQWRTVFRGEPLVKNDSELTPRDIADANLVLWGEPSTNRVLAKLVNRLPIQWDASNLSIGKIKVSSESSVPVLVYPNPLNPKRYVVLNSSFTFREGSAQSNAKQTPKLPDWALVDLQTPPDKTAPGQIVDAGFFDEQWQLPTN